MRAFNFMKIDYIKTKTQMILVPLMLLFVAMIMMAPDSDVSSYSAVVPFCYMVFMMTIFSASPFGSCRREESGFLQLLPASTWDRVIGRFFYGISLMLIAAAMGVGAMAAYHMMGFTIGRMDIPICMMGLAAGILIMTAEYVFFYLFGENKGANLLGIVRTIPGMCMFFVTANVYKAMMREPDQAARIMQGIGSRLTLIAGGSVTLSVMILAAAIVLCVKVTEKRDC